MGSPSLAFDCSLIDTLIVEGTTVGEEGEGGKEGWRRRGRRVDEKDKRGRGVSRIRAKGEKEGQEKKGRDGRRREVRRAEK